MFVHLKTSAYANLTVKKITSAANKVSSFQYLGEKHVSKSFLKNAYAHTCPQAKYVI